MDAKDMQAKHPEHHSLDMQDVLGNSVDLSATAAKPDCTAAATKDSAWSQPSRSKLHAEQPSMVPDQPKSRRPTWVSTPRRNASDEKNLTPLYSVFEGETMTCDVQFSWISAHKPRCVY